MPHAVSSKCCASVKSLKFLGYSPGEITHAIQVIDSFDAAHPLTILLQLIGLTSYFDAYSPSSAEYENEEIAKIHLIVE